MAPVFLRASAHVLIAVFGMACGHHPPAKTRVDVEAPDLASATCASLAQATLAKVAALPRPADESYGRALPSDHGFGQCRAGLGGEWLLEVEKAEVVEDGDQATGGPQLRLFVMLTFVARDGRVFRAPPEKEGLLEGAAAFVSVVGTQLLSLEETFDWSDDGVAEVVVREDISSGSDITVRRIWTFREGAPVVWAEAPQSIESIRDVDGDGRPDVLSTAPFEVSLEYGLYSETVPRTLRHLSRSVPGGFETDGPAVEAYYRATCGPAREAAAIDGTELDDVVQQAICARLYGADDAAVAQRVDALARPIVEAGGGEYQREGPFLEDPPVRL